MLKLSGKNSKTLPDEELIRKYQSSGDLEYLGELYSRYMTLIYGVCLKYLKTREDSKDALMQIFENLAREFPSYELRNFRSWLFVVTKNFCLMQIRSERNRDKKVMLLKNDSLNFMEYEDFLHPVDDEFPEKNIALRECIEKLKNDQKKCIKWFYFESKSYREIAGYPDMNEKKVKSLIQNAKRNLKICMETKNVKKI